MDTMRLSFVLVLSAIVLTTHPLALRQQQPAVPTAAEYPETDWGIFYARRAGAMNKVASARLASDPDSLDTFDLLVQARRSGEAVQVLHRALKNGSAGIDRVIHSMADGARALLEPPRRIDDRLVRELSEKAHRHLATLSGEDAARFAFQLARFESGFSTERRGDWPQQLERLVRTYEGTREALLWQVDVLENQALRGRPLSGGENLGRFDEFIREHAGTVAGAKALYTKGFRLAHSTLQRRGSDPTERLLDVLRIVQELESGRYPTCEWVDKAPSLVIGFMAYQPRYAPGNDEKNVAAYLEFVRSHFTLDPDRPGSDGIAYVLTSKVPEILRASGADPSEIERIFDTFERQTGKPAEVRFLRAHFYLKQLRDFPDAPERRAWYQNAQDAFAAVHKTGSGWIARRALATLATVQFAEREYVKALLHLRRYVTSYPESEWSWLAALRIGDSEAALGNTAAAADAYRAAAQRFAGVPYAAVYGHTRAARTFEALGNFAEALAQYRAAVETWDPDYGDVYRLVDVRVRPEASMIVPGSMYDELRRAALEQRAAELAASLATGAGEQLERGRALIDGGRREQGIAVLREVTAKYPKSPAAAAALDAINRARVDAALDLADVENPRRNEAAAVKELETLASEPVSFWTAAAKLARGALLWKHQPIAAEQIGIEGLGEFRASQKAHAAATPAAGLEGDCLEIRNLVFRPELDGAFAGTNWEYSRSIRQKPFYLLRSAIAVKLPDGSQVDVPATWPLRDFDNAIFVGPEQLQFFERLMTRLGGTKRRPPTHIMQPPNQPAGAAVDVLAYLNRLFPASPGHWGGWMFETFPMITSIEFLDADRTKAAVSFTIRWEGAILMLEKRDGGWTVKSVEGRWIT